MPATPPVSKADDDHAYASILDQGDIEMLWQICKPNTNLLGEFIGAYCGILKVDPETFHDTVAMAACSIHQAQGNEREETYITPYRFLDKSDRKDYVGRLLETSAALKSFELTQSSIEQLRLFKKNITIIDTSLLVGACMEYGKHMENAMTYEKARSGGEILISRMYEKLGNQAVKNHLDSFAQSFQQWLLAGEARYILLGEKAKVPTIKN